MRRAALALALACAVGCTTNDGSLQIYAAITPDSNCVFTPAGEAYFTTGTYDPRGFGGVRPRGYRLGLAVRNTLGVPSTETAGGANANDAQIISVDTCWFPAHPGSDGQPEFESYVDGVPDNLTCSKLPEAQKKTVTTASPVPTGSSAGIVVDLFEDSVLQQLYGADFEPWKIPDAGAVPLVQGDVVTWKYAFNAADPGDLGGRDAAWGNFPAQPAARVIVQARANAVLLSGGNIQSNWFIYPVDICPGCLATTCGLQNMEECVAGDVCTDGNACPPAGACPDGSFCTGTTCPDGTACPSPTCQSGGACNSGTWDLSGNIPDPLSGTVCLPFQDAGPPCVSTEACGGTSGP